MEKKIQEVFINKDLNHLSDVVDRAVKAVTSAFRQGNKLLVCGNGGSSADSDHIVGELMKSFEKPRPLDAGVRQKLGEQFGSQGAMLAENLQQGLPAISLAAHNALVTAISNDIGGEYIFAQQVISYGREGDVLLAISTSGNSENICNALMVAKTAGMITIGLTGQSGGKIKLLCDILINVPGTHTAAIQECQLPVYHALCRMIEAEMFD